MKRRCVAEHDVNHVLVCVQLWRYYYGGTDLLIFVVDSSDRERGLPARRINCNVGWFHSCPGPGHRSVWCIERQLLRFHTP